MKFFSKQATAAFSKVVATIFLMSLLFNHSFCRAQILEFTETYDLEASVVVDDVDGGKSGGIDVAISGNGMYIAVGVSRGGVKNKGYVKVYSKQGGVNWSTMQHINGTVNWNRFGFSVDLSEDGSIMAITSQNKTAYVYQLSTSTSNPEYEEIFDEDCNAREVAVSPDGSVVAVALDDSNDNIGAKIFERNGVTFQQRGVDLSDSGKSGGIALSKDGSRIVLADREGKGRVWVLDWNDVEERWDPIGSIIEGENNGDNLGFGECVSITHDGKFISIGAPRYDQNGKNKGLVRVYKYKPNQNRYKKIGDDLVGDNAQDRFSTNALSSDGTYLIVGAYGGDGADYLKIFKKDGNNYSQIGANIIGEGGQFAYAVDMSSDGSKFVVGSNLPNDEGKAYLYVSPPTGNGNGDPHFTTFAGTTFDYHGECDLVMLSSPSFASGSGLSVHVRTTRMDGRLLSYSYISGAAVAIGHNVLEVQQDGTLTVNGIRYIHESMSFPTEFATYPFTKNMIGKKKKITQYVLNLSDNNVDSMKDEVKDSDFRANPVTITIHANPKTRMLFVKIEGDVHDGIGLLGNPFARNQLLGRDGVTDMSYDWNTYGEEWQVRDTEPKLFQELRAPQYPETCIYYASDNGHMKKTHNLRRRLLNDAEGGIVMVSKEAATEACADYVGAFKDNCIYDVMIMGDLDVAEDPSYMG